MSHPYSDLSFPPRSPESRRLRPSPPLLHSHPQLRIAAPRSVLRTYLLRRLCGWLHDSLHFPPPRPHGTRQATQLRIGGARWERCRKSIPGLPRHLARIRAHRFQHCQRCRAVPGRREKARGTEQRHRSAWRPPVHPGILIPDWSG